MSTSSEQPDLRANVFSGASMLISGSGLIGFRLGCLFSV